MIKEIFAKLESKKDIIFCIIAVLLIVIFARSISPKRLQNDTFYTVTIGKLISENGIDMKDHFSWHEGLPYTYPHWLYDLGMYFIYKTGGWDYIYISTCLFAIILGICIFFVNSRVSKNKLISFLVTIGVMYLLKGYIAARAQLITFILFILLLYNIERVLSQKKGKKIIINAFMLFIIHLLIANLHVAVWPFSFVLYLPYIAEYLTACLIDVVLYKKVSIFYLNRRIKSLNKKIKLNHDLQKIELKVQKLNEKLQQKVQKVEKIKQKRIQDKDNSYKISIEKNKNTKWLIIIMLISVLTGLLTPLGKTPFVYTYLTMIGDTVKNINEHLPLTLINNIPILCTLIVILAVLTFSRAKIKLSDLLMLGGLIYLMFSSRRQQNMFVLIGSVAFTRTITNWLLTSLNLSSDKIMKKYVNVFTIFVLSVLIIILSNNLYKDIKNSSYISKKTYPVEASEWILKNLDVKNIKLFNEYNYGSYLLYKGIPVFIDSRADLYSPEFNTATGDKKDGKNIFMDFINCSGISSYYGSIFEKYGVTHVIIGKNSKINMLIKKTDSEKYEELYSDDYFVIYEVL